MGHRLFFVDLGEDSLDEFEWLGMVVMSRVRLEGL